MVKSIEIANPDTPASDSLQLDRLEHFIRTHPRLLVLTGAGCSVASGIPAYRDTEGIWQRSTPVQHADFIQHASSRRRYWARSLAGWPAVAEATPNPAHQHLAVLESLGFVEQLVTQNVDGLHQKAGHERVIDLHGRLDQVVCLNCGDLSQRQELQETLLTLNPHGSVNAAPAPDGDADVLTPENFIVPTCRKCDGMLKPNVVFFGGSVDKSLVDRIYALIEQVDAVLTIGTSLMVFSGFRFCRRAHHLGKPVASINPGKTRADDITALKITLSCESALGGLTRSLNYR